MSELKAENKLSYGEQIVNLLDGLKPEEKRNALMEAKSRMMDRYRAKVADAEADLKSASYQLNEFEGTGSLVDAVSHKC